MFFVLRLSLLVSAASSPVASLSLVRSFSLALSCRFRCQLGTLIAYLIQLKGKRPKITPCNYFLYENPLSADKRIRMLLGKPYLLAQTDLRTLRLRFLKSASLPLFVFPPFHLLGRLIFLAAAAPPPSERGKASVSSHGTR